MHIIENPDQFRANICTKFVSIIANETTATNLEKAIYNYAIKEANTKKIIKKWSNGHFSQIYLDRLRTIYFNLRNPELLLQLTSGKMSPQTLAFMTHQEMKPERWSVLIERKIIRDKSKLSTNVQASTDMFTCKKCKGKRTTFYELQTRSADEPATIFVTCLDCGQNMKK